MIELITKRLLKKDKSISQEEAERRAGEIWAAYCEANKERDGKRDIEHRKRFERALDNEFDNLAFEELTGEELIKYFKGEENG